MKILRNIVFYLLFFILGFFLGVQFANIIEAGKGQMLAGGAIVLGHGVVGAIIGLVFSIFISIMYKSKPKVIVLANKILAVAVFGFIIFFWVKYKIKESNSNSTMGCEIKSTFERSISSYNSDYKFG